MRLRVLARCLAVLLVAAGTVPSGAVRFGAQARFGDAIDLANAREASSLRLVANASLRMGRHLDVSLAQTYERLARSGERIVDAYLSEVRTAYSFTARAFLRAIVQHRATDRNAAAYSVPVDRFRRTTFVQFLFGYEVRPQTLFYIGYSDDRVGLRDHEDLVVPLTQTSRTFFAKLSYAWRP